MEATSLHPEIDPFDRYTPESVYTALRAMEKGEHEVGDLTKAYNSMYGTGIMKPVISSLVNELEAADLVSIRREGRKKYVTLTE
jgi:DNA-binding transcriptional ArsR family regulator